VGKIFINDAILSKPGPLTAQETEMMKAHPVAGAQMLAEISNLHGVLGGVRHHHERYDGQGYPDGRQGDEIPLAARIIAVADTYDAITTQRPYRKARSPQQAAQEIAAAAGSQLCPSVARAFRSLFDVGYFALTVDEPPSSRDLAFGAEPMFIAPVGGKRDKPNGVLSV
jgi:HD-GYP domain-containing protein (c-di-GMP phosphodiesterase class II)